ncbi:hypothetical protein HJ526_02930 [Donghicola sp. C2-DW-16]|uniref:Flagella-associated GTP-binding protein n=1 Tax=Donghicola mangrovi TaxID=2729614 RepID=A0ABX2PA64_9RHOB|nr:hypothetical protein [Donghicola mangrovi]NVO26363.1 hypothetical protein [Donghicola mangrovi]
MPTTVVRAEDSAQAMDEVIARLGPDALILSTVKRNGMVEITATTDPIPPKDPKPAPKPVVAPEVSPEPRSADIVPLPQVEAPKVVATHAPKVDAQKPGFSRLFKSRMNPTEAELEVSVPETPEGIAALIRRIQIAPAANVLRAHRIVLVGRVGAGKSLQALQIAAQQAQAGHEVRVSYVGASHADGAYLMSKARLLGCPMDYANPEILMTPPSGDLLHIVVVSGRLALPDTVIDAMALQDDTRTVLTLPLGMRRRTVLTSASQWRALDPVVTLTTNPGDLLDPDDLSGLIDAGLPLTWLSASKSVIGGLTAADREGLSAALTQELPAGIRSLYAQKPQSTGGVE